MSAPARACDTAVFARRSSVGSLRISSPCTTPQCPWSVYSHRQTSVITRMLCTSFLIADAASWTVPCASYAPEALASFASGMPNRRTAGTPSERASCASATASSTDRLY